MDIEIMMEISLLLFQALVQTEQAKEDIVRLQSRMADMVTEQQEKLQLEREATRRESQEEIAQLNHRVSSLFLKFRFNVHPCGSILSRNKSSYVITVFLHKKGLESFNVRT